MKATYVEITNPSQDDLTAQNGPDIIGREIFKDPITGDGTKKSARGLLQVVSGNNGLALIDQVKKAQENQGELQVIFEDGEFHNTTTLTEIRERINKLI